MAFRSNPLTIYAFILLLIGLGGVFIYWGQYQNCTSTVGKLARAFDRSFDSECQDNIGYFYLFSGSTVVGVLAILVSRISNKSDVPEIRQVEKDEALEVARMRYARGEITVEEFEKIKKQLE